MALLETFLTGISVASTAKTLYDWVIGNTITQKIDKLSVKVEQLDKKVYYLAEQEVWNASKIKQEIIEDLKKIKTVAKPIQQAIGMDLVVSKPIVTPQRLNTAFLNNPEEILFDIKPLRGNGIPSGYICDPTLIPVTFSKWGQDFIGLIKSGYARDYLDLEFTPKIEIINPSPSSFNYSTVGKIGGLSENHKLIWDKFVSVISERLNVREDGISYDTLFLEDLGADSLDQVELIMACEDEFEIRIPEESVENIRTVGEAFELGLGLMKI